MSTGAVVARILTQYSDKGSKQAQKDIAKLGKQIDAFGKKAAKSFKLAVVATAALSVKIGKDAVAAAIEDSRSQIVLANAMANTTGATKEAIAAAEGYISKTQFRVNVADDQLRQSLASLYIATGDLTEAERLQGIALDVSAASGKDLFSVTAAITKAQQGNVTILKKLSPELSGLIGKTTKAEQVFALLEDTYGGTAQALADTDPLTKLKLAYGDVLETLGYELLPVVKEFAKYIVDIVVPAIEEWLKANGSTLRDGLKAVIDIVLNFTKTLGDLAAFYAKWEWVIKVAFAFLALGRALKLINYVARPLSGIFKALESTGGGVAGAFKKLGEIFARVFLKFTSVAGSKEFAGIYKVFERLAKVIGTLAGGFILLGTAGIAASNGLKDLFGIDAWPWEKNVKNAVDYVSTLTEKTYGGAAAEKYLGEKAAARAKRQAAARAAAAAAAAKEAAATAKQAAAEALRAKVLAQIAKFGVKPGTGKANIKGVTPLSTLDPAAQEAIQFEAVRLNLIKQANIAEQARWAAIMKGYEALTESNKALARYNDLLAALADKEISSEELTILAKKWGMTKEAAMSYIQTLIAVSDGKISDDEIVNLAKAWGSTKEQASRYLDFFNALNDGYLSNAEIEKLKTTWGLSSKEVQVYADLITKASDYVLSDKEIEDLKKNWGLTTDEVVAYIRKLGQPVTFSGTLIDPATQATLGWKSALDALLAYQAALAGKGYSGSSGSSGSSNGYVFDPAASADANKEAADAAAAAADAAAAVAEANSAATAAALAAADAILGTNSGNNYSGDDGIARRAAAAGLATKNAAETARLAALAKQSAQADAYAAGMAAKYGGFVGSSTLNNASGIGTSNSSSPVVVNLTVNGSVTTENDLVATVRQGLLRGQYNGQSLTLEAV